jgi:hypothetical protein
MEAVFDGGGLRREDWNRYAAASVLQASGFRRDVTMFRLKCTVAENWLGAGASAQHGGMRVHNRGGS